MGRPLSSHHAHLRQGTKAGEVLAERPVPLPVPSVRKTPAPGPPIVVGRRSAKPGSGKVATLGFILAVTLSIFVGCFRKRHMQPSGGRRSQSGITPLGLIPL